MAYSRRMRVLVTGAAGFVGEALMRRLDAQGVEVLGADLRAAPLPTVRMDVTDPAEVEGVFVRHRPTHVVHCAAIVDDRVPYAVTERVNVGGTRHVLASARRHGVERFVHVSSIAALGLDPGPGADEDSPLRMDTGVAYFDTKARSEELARDAMRAGDVVVVRPGDVYGPGSVPWVERPVEMMRARMPVLLGGGRGRMAPCWIDNLVDGLLLALEHADAPGQIFAFTDGEEGCSYRDYMTRLADAARLPRPRAIPRGVAMALARVGERLPVAMPLTAGAVAYVTRRASYSLEASRRVLGWSPAVGLEEAMAELARHLA